MVIKNVLLHFEPGVPVRVAVSQYDTMWQFVFTLMYNGEQWVIPNTATVMLNGIKPDGNVFSFAGTISDGKAVVNCDIQMTAVKGNTLCELSITDNDKVVGTRNFVLEVEAAPVEENTVVSDSEIDAYGAIIASDVGTYISQHPEIVSHYGITDEAKQALLNLLQAVAYVSTDGQELFNAVANTLLPSLNVVSISATFTQGSFVVYDTDPLAYLRAFLVVTALYDNYQTETVTDYTLSGTLTTGTSLITVIYGKKSDTFTVTVTADPLSNDYTRVLYVASTSTTSSGPFVNTQVTPAANKPMIVSIGVMLTTVRNESSNFIGSLQKGSNAAIGFGVGLTGNGNPIAFNGISSGISDRGSRLGIKEDLLATFSSTSSSISDGVETISTTGTGRNHDTPIHLFGIKRSAAEEYIYFARGRIYYAKVIDNGVLKLNVAPVIRNSDSVAGFYDYVNERFITAEGLVAGTTEEGE